MSRGNDEDGRLDEAIAAAVLAWGHAPMVVGKCVREAIAGEGWKLVPPGGVTVPDDLVAWFEGRAILAERHNLARIETRWRVIEVIGLLGDPLRPYVCKGEWREFKTRTSAEKYRDKLAKEGATVLIQPGFTFWPDPDEYPEPDVVRPSHEVAAIGE